MLGEKGEIDPTVLQEEVIAKLAEEVITDPAAFIDKIGRDRNVLSIVYDFLRKIKKQPCNQADKQRKSKIG